MMHWYWVLLLCVVCSGVMGWIGLIFGYDEGFKDLTNAANRRFEEGKRFERRNILARVDRLKDGKKLMSDAKHRRLAHDLGLCGCTAQCCCYPEEQ